MIPGMMIVGQRRGATAINNTKSLLHFDGVDASTTFTDATGKAWTPNGNVQIDTAQSQFGGASALLDATGDYITTPDHADWSLLGNFTVEAWVRRTAAGRDAIFTKYSAPTAGILFDVGPADELRLILGAGSYITCSSGATTVPIGSWAHVAGVRNGGGLAVYINGTQVGTSAITGTVANSAGAVYLGRDPLDTTRDFGGHIDEFRFSNSARYTSNFTPSGPFGYPG